MCSNFRIYGISDGSWMQQARCVHGSGCTSLPPCWIRKWAESKQESRAELNVNGRLYSIGPPFHRSPPPLFFFYHPGYMLRGFLAGRGRRFSSDLIVLQHQLWPLSRRETRASSSGGPRPSAAPPPTRRRTPAGRRTRRAAGRRTTTIRGTRRKQGSHWWRKCCSWASRIERCGLVF